MLIDFNPDIISDPEEADRAAESFSLLRKYCAVKAAAIRSRLAGDIADALEMESKLDALYARLPEDLRW